MSLPKIFGQVSLWIFLFGISIACQYLHNTGNVNAISVNENYKTEAPMIIDAPEFKSGSMDGLLGIEIKSQRSTDDITYDDLYDIDELLYIAMSQGYVVKAAYLALDLDRFSKLRSYIIKFSVAEKDTSKAKIKRNSLNFIQTIVLPLTLEMDSRLEFIGLFEPEPKSFEVSKGKYWFVANIRDLSHEEGPRWYPGQPEVYLWEPDDNMAPLYVQITLYKTKQEFEAFTIPSDEEMEWMPIFMDET